MRLTPFLWSSFVVPNVVAFTPSPVVNPNNSMQRCFNTALSADMRSLNVMLNQTHSQSDESATDLDLNNANYQPVAEEVTVHRFEVRGEIPKGLDGLYVRNGPNPQVDNKDHLFLGKGMLHGVWLQNQTAVAYRNRYVTVGSNDFWGGLNNVAAVHYQGDLLSLGEIGPPLQVNSSTLETLGRYSFENKSLNNMAAHPKIDAKDGFHAFSYNVLSKPYLTYLHAVKSTDSNGTMPLSTRLTKIMPIHLPEPKMVHDMAITENFVVVFDLSIQFSLANAITGMMNQVMGARTEIPFLWNSDSQARIGVFPKSGQASDIQWFDIEDSFFFHTLNAYEVDDGIVLDVARYDKFMAKGASDFSEPAQLARYELNQKTGESMLYRLDTQMIEMPCINPKYQGRPYRFAYCLSTSRADGSRSPDKFTAMIKYDLQQKTYSRFAFDSHLVASEFTFVPAENATQEDEGYLIGYVFNQNTTHSELWILNAQDFSEQQDSFEPEAIISLGVRVPNGFHGTWVAGAKFVA